MKYKIILFDIDDTLLDFSKSEEIAISNLMKYYNIIPTKENCELYHRINIKYWKMFENKQITRNALLVERFKDFFKEFNIEDDFEKTNNLYFDILSQLAYVIEGAEDLLEKLSKNYDLYGVTNGTTRVQKGRLAKTNIHKFLKQIYLSEEIGFQKPDIKYFDFVFEDIKIINKEEVLIIGDSVTSDIQGGINAGIDTVWYNPKENVSDIKCTYIVKNYQEIMIILEIK